MTYLKNRSDDNKKKYTSYKNVLTTVIRKSKDDFHYKLFKRLKYDIKKTWNKINQLLGKKKINKIPQNMYDKTTQINSSKNIAEAFNSYFVSLGQKLAEQIPQLTQSTSDYMSEVNVVNSLFLKPISIFEIIKVCSHLDSNKSCGFDDISQRVVKQCIYYFVEPLNFIFNLSITSGIVPQKFKIAKVIPLFKKHDERDISNYRPIALLPTFSKVFEKLIHERLYTFLINNNILINEQYGFRKNYSTYMAVLKLSDYILQEMENGKYSVGVFMDLSKAFDTVDHDILLAKLHHYGVRGVPLNLFKSYLNERKQFVMVDGVRSNTQNITCGVPQGSVLGPLLFLLYINDITKCSSLFKYSLFADDTCVIMSHNDPVTLISLVNSEINKLSVWFQKINCL